MKRDLIRLLDYSSEEILGLIDSADRLKKQKGKLRTDLKGKSVALVFQKPSNRTRDTVPNDDQPADLRV